MQALRVRSLRRKPENEEFMKSLSEIHPIYLFYGPEDFLIEQEIESLLERTLSAKERGLNLHSFNGETSSPQEIVQAAQTIPMFSRYRFVLVKEADHLDEEEIAVIAGYLGNPSPTTCLVLKAQTLGPWKKYRADIEKTGKVVEYPRLKGKALNGWMNTRMKEKGKSLSEEAASFIIEAVGDNLQGIENTLERVSLAVGEKKNIELSDIEDAVSDVKVSTVYDLTEAIGHQNLEKALSILERVIGSKAILFRKDEEVSKMDDPVPLLLSMMARQYRTILRVKEQMKQQNKLDEVARLLKIPPWKLKNLAEQGKRFSEASLREGILKCHQTDLAIKKGRGVKELLMEKLVIDLCRPRGK
jgi:DNA polymerase-3 subunit delta